MFENIIRELFEDLNESLDNCVNLIEKEDQFYLNLINSDISEFSYLDLNKIVQIFQESSIQKRTQITNSFFNKLNLVLNNIDKKIKNLTENKHKNKQNYPYQQHLKPFNYQLMSQYSISQNESCFAIAINKDCSTLVVGCQSQIKVFDFKQGMMNEIQILSQHKSDVQTLNFMKKQNQFISGSLDRSIIIWYNNISNQWIPYQTLNGHKDFIYCLILNNNDDLIVSGSYDTTIKFWIKNNEWLCYQTITDHSASVHGLNLNQQQDRVISCSSNGQILIIQQSKQNKEWMVIQKITVEQNGGSRICFIDNNIFTFQPYGKEQMSVFEMNKINEQYTITQHFSVKCGSDGKNLFPSQYINSKCLLVSKCGQYINLIRKKQNGEFITEQSIFFGTSSLFGIMSDNGEYLITWDSESEQIQIRNYYEE